MTVKLDRDKPRNWLLSIAYKLVRYFPVSKERKLDFLLDVEWIATRLAYETQSGLGLDTAGRNDFLLDAIKPTDRVLDLGCSTGGITGSITARQVVGIDHDADRIKQASKAHPHCLFVCADAADYLATSETFDVLVLSHILEHIDGPQAFLAQFAGKFGRIYVEVPDFDTAPLNRVRLVRKRSLIFSDNDHVSEFDRRDIEYIFSSCGLEVIDREYINGVMRYWLTKRAAF